MTENHDGLENLISSAMKNLREMLDVNTIVGDAILGENNTTVIPISRISCGFLAGGGDMPHRHSEIPFLGGSGAGLQVQPVGFLVMHGDQIRLIPVGNITNMDRAIDAISLLAEQFGNLCKKQHDEADQAQKK